MKPLIFSLDAPSLLLDNLIKTNQFELGKLYIHNFPDQETFLRYDSELKDKPLVFIVGLDKPNLKFLPLYFALRTARELGAKRIGLVAPYLPYMRQDIRFSPGEAVTSVHFSKLLSDCADWLITIDPHLHRYHSLNDIYTIPTYVLHATNPIASWIAQNTKKPLIIGPDSESEQWVAAIATAIHAPYEVLNKVRRGDNNVEVSFPSFNQFSDFQPVLVDDIISTGTTFVETIKHLTLINMKKPICIGVHALFANQAYENILNAGANKVISCNTVEHCSNEIDLSSLITECLGRVLSS